MLPNLNLRRDPPRDLMARKENHQGPSHCPCLTERTGPVGHLRDKPRRLLGCFLAADGRQPTRLFPRIETEPRECRDDGQRHSIDFLADGREQELIEIATQRADRSPQSLYAIGGG